MWLQFSARCRLGGAVLGLAAALQTGPVLASTRPAPPETVRSSNWALSGAAIGLEEDPDDALTEARVELAPDGRELSLTGDLAEGVADRVAAVLAAHPGVERLRLTSDGGFVEEALALGALVAAYGLATYVPDVCASACTLVFVRGRGRSLAEGGRLGFHGPYVTGFFEVARSVDPTAERKAYLAAGLQPDFVAQALAVRADAIWVPDAAQLRAAGVVTDLAVRDDPPRVLRADAPTTRPDPSADEPARRGGHR